MEIIRATCRCLLERLAGYEFEVTGGATPNSLRRAYLRYMHVRYGQKISLGRNTYIRNRGNLELGERCALGSFIRIWNYAPIIIGDDFLSAGGLTLNSATHDPESLASIGLPITIGNRVWCGQNVTILAGVTIGDDVVIGAGSVVVHDLPKNSIAVGVPARVIKPLLRKQPFEHPVFSHQA